jgi:hypothetical protein
MLSCNFAADGKAPVLFSWKTAVGMRPHWINVDSKFVGASVGKIRRVPSQNVENDNTDTKKKDEKWHFGLSQ